MPENTPETTETAPEQATPPAAQEAHEETPEEVTEDQLLSLPVEKLAAMLRDKRKAEQTVRSKLRDAEAERDRLSGAVTGYQRRAFAEAAKGHQMHETALDDVLAAVKLEDVLAEDGTVDAGKVGPALAELRKVKPHYFHQVKQTRASGVEMFGGEPYRPQSSWTDVLH